MGSPLPDDPDAAVALYHALGTLETALVPLSEPPWWCSDYSSWFVAPKGIPYLVELGVGRRGFMVSVVFAPYGGSSVMPEMLPFDVQGVWGPRSCFPTTDQPILDAIQYVKSLIAGRVTAPK